MYVALFVVSLIVVIMFHEFGHYITAKAFGMKVEKFFLGFGPTLWSFRKGETEYGVKGIPAGGFVKISGMSEHEEVPPEDRSRAFYTQPAWQRFIVLVSGSVTHFILAFALMFAALAFVGLPTGTSQVSQVVDDSPAAAAGLQPDDEILSIAGVPTEDFDAVSAAVNDRPGETVQVEVLRDGRRLTLTSTIADTKPTGEPGGFLGVGPVVSDVPMSVGAAARGVFVGDYSVPRLTQLTMGGVVQALSPTGLGQWLGQLEEDAPRDPEAGGVISLVGAGQIFSAFGASGDLFALLVLLVALNIIFGVLNMAPLPPLDGGHVAVLLIEQGVNGVRRVRGRPATWRLDPAVITPIAIAVVLFFVILNVIALYLDITKPLGDLLQ
ncbi:MAG TPA: site-2 protease family protein [Egibacteraceae bacterium]|nr:site-2 protease family protein [Egibacteraceae bacterium]